MPNYRLKLNDQDDGTPNIHRVSETPDLGQMTKEMHTALVGASDFYDRAQRALDVRECWWENQSPDGRKHSTANAKAFPWEHASDTRVRTVDMIINEKVKLKKIALARMNVQAVPTPANDMERGNRLATLLRYYLRGPMSNEAQREIELLANYQETFGSTVLGVGWHQPLSYEVRTLTIDDFVQLAAADGTVRDTGDVAAMLYDQRPEMEQQTIEWIMSLSPLLTKREARRVLVDMRTLAEAELAVPYIAESRPCLRALQCMQDVIFPVQTWDLQRSRFVAERELLTRTELEEKAEGREEWDEDFVAALLEHPGDTFNSTLGAMALAARQQQLTGLWNSTMNETEDLYEVWHFYHRASFRGVPCLYRTVMSPALGEGGEKALYGKHEMVEGTTEYPHIEYVREFRARSILSSRGLPEVLDTDQREIKVQRDARIDLSSITTAPMLRKKPRVGSDQYAFGPGIVISASKDEIEPITWRIDNSHSVEVEKATKHGVNEYVGRTGEGIPPELVNLHQESDTQDWLARWAVAGRQLGRLAQKYTPPLTIAKLTGVSEQPVEITPENIAGDFTLILTFDPRFSSPEFVFGMLERVEKYVMPLDSNAIINRDELIRWAFAGIDPTLADRVVRDANSAQQSEIEDEQNNLALMVTGQAPPMKLKGQNYAVRLNVLQSSLQANAGYYQALLQMRPDFRALLEQRVAFLEQQIAQDKNRVIGIFGTSPTASSPGMSGAGGDMGGMPGGPGLGQFAMAGGAQ